MQALQAALLRARLPGNMVVVMMNRQCRVLEPVE